MPKMTPAQLKELYERAGSTFKKQNPHLMGELSSPVKKPDGRQALEQRKERARQCAAGPQYRVEFLFFCSRLANDDDNRAGTAGTKHLRDKIAEWLGFDDNQKCIQWQYHPLIYSPIEGTLIVIHPLKTKEEHV